MKTKEWIPTIVITILLGLVSILAISNQAPNAYSAEADNEQLYLPVVLNGANGDQLNETATPTASPTNQPTYTPTPTSTQTATPTATATPSASNLCLDSLASVSQSSTLDANEAARACDGNKDGNAANGSVARTNSDANAFWEVDLGFMTVLQQIKLFSCTSCADFTSNFHIFVSNQPFSSTDLATTQNQSGVKEYYFEGGVDSFAFAPEHQAVRYIRIQLAGTDTLDLAEVEIIGAPWVPDECSGVADIFYIVDISGSMAWEFPGADSKMEAVKDALTAVNNEVIATNNDTRVGFVTFSTGSWYWSGNDNHYHLPTQLNTTPLTTDVTMINTLVPDWQPLGATPTGTVLNSARLTMIDTWDPLRIPIVILISDGVPTADLDEFYYSEEDVKEIQVYDGNNNPYTPAEVALTGNIITGSNHYSDKPAGAVVAETMREILELKASLPDITVHTITIEGSDFNSQVLQYVAERGGGDYSSSNNVSDLTSQLSDLYNSISCDANP